MALAGLAVLLAGCGASLNSELSSLPVGQAGAPDASPDKQATTLAGGAAAVASEKPKKGAAGAIAATETTKKQPTAPGAKKAAEAITAAGTFGNAGYKIGTQDVLEISVFKVQELSKLVQVSENGTINLPLLGEVNAAGRTATELERNLKASLGAKYLQNPQVTVYVKEYNSQRVTLEGGGVKKPGVYPLKGSMTLLQLIATAEGMTDVSGSEVAVFREESGKRMAAKFDIAAIRSGDMKDPALRAGDVVVTSTSAAKETFNYVIKALPLAGIFALL